MTCFHSHYKFIRLLKRIQCFRMSSSSKRRNSEEEMVGEQIQALIAPPAPDKKQSKASKSTFSTFSLFLNLLKYFRLEKEKS